jgi:TolB-like protein/class 3 adenylate cyclase
VTEAVSTSRILSLVFTDLADSTALKTRHGDQAAGDLIARHRALVQRLAEEHGGRIVDWAGDGCFLTFERPSAAVTFALRLQETHAVEPDLPGVRVGMHMGEVSERPGAGEDDHARVEGLAVDLAARISGLARPAQVLMSSAVADSARPRVDSRAFRRPIVWRTCGSYTLKGVDGPIEVRAVGLDGLSNLEVPPAGDKAAPLAPPQATRVRGRVLAIAALVALAGAAAYYFMVSRAPRPGTEATARRNAAESLAFAARPAIAVLPFDNLSPDPEQAIFADGLAEDLITRLSTWRSFPVIARNSSFKYRGGNLDLKQVGSELGARYLVEGSVRRAGDRIRVTAQLIDAPSDEHVWAKSYDRAVKDVFALQDEISATIAASLVDDLTRAEGERARQRGTENLEAWGFYQLGLQHFDRYTFEDFSEARRLFERATKLDPRFATAFGYVAVAGLSDLMLGRKGPHQELVSGLMANARQAVELDARDPVAQLGLAGAYLAMGETKQALDSARRAIDLNPSMPGAWIWLGWTQILSGDPEAAITATERAQRLNPQGSMVWIYDNFANAHWELGRYEEALKAAQQLVAVQPSYFPGYAYMAMNSVALGRLDAARAAIAEGIRTRPDLSLDLMQDYYGVSRPDVDARRNAALRQAGLK